MDDFNDNEIARLLRLKRYEQPPPGYFENFLHEFHRRQRDELLRQPLWRICLERTHDFMFRLNVPSLTSYPAAIAAVSASQRTAPPGAALGPPAWPPRPSGPRSSSRGRRGA